MYFNLYHVSILREIVQFLRKIECIEFACNKLVLVLVQIDLIQFENSNCISSIWTKTSKKNCYIQIQYIQFSVKLDMWYKL